MKVRSKNEYIKATRVFTDREEPRAAFWKNYERCEAEMTNDGNIHVLTYYGIGGIGKSRLLKKLMSEMDERFTDKRYVYFDFNIQQESRAVLTALKNKLTEQCKFTFPLFELGSYMYAKKVGGNPDAPEIQQMTEKSPFLSLVLSIAGNIPMLGFATSMLSLADQCVAYVRTYLKNHSRELKQIEYMEAEELYRLLPYLFAQDLTHNQEHSGKLLVVLLDTYERLVNELSSTGDPLMNDLWIRGEESLIQNIPNVLWVIAGREKLKWERFDPDWAEALEQHILGNLSLADSDSFLSAAGVGGSELRQQLYELTNGTPVYLDLCVDQFARLSAKGIMPEISMFGQNTHELIERFIRYMSDSQKDLVYTLACLQMWNDDLIMRIAGEILPNFSLSTYEKAKDFSFVIQSDDNWYNIHQTVGEVLVAHCPQLLKEKICQKTIDHFSEEIKVQDFLSAEYVSSLAFILKSELILAKGILETRQKILGNDHMDTIIAMDNLANTYCKMGHSEKACKIYEEVLPKYRNLLGNHHPDTVTVIGNFANALFDLARYEEALPLYEEVLPKYRDLFGERHDETLRASGAFSYILCIREDYSRAITILEKLLEIEISVYGKDNLATITHMEHLAYALYKVGREDEARELEAQFSHT